MNQILFFDIEVSESKKTIKDIGAIWNGTHFHKNSITEFAQFVSNASTLCGHNIINHDLQILENTIVSESLKNKLYIDTLYLSALLFAEKPYHKLIKDYKLFHVEAEFNNPVSDSKLCKELLKDEIERFNSLDETLKTIYFLLLKEEKPFEGFFKLLNYSSTFVSISQSIHAKFKGRICQNAQLDNLVQNH